MNGENLLIGLSYIDRKYIEEAEKDTISSRRMIHKPFLIAAIIALMLLLMGCAAAVLVHLNDLRMGEETYTANQRYHPDGSTIPAGEKVKSVYSLQGAEGSKNYSAAMEWYEYIQSEPPRDPDFQVSRAYDAYYASSQDMVNKVDAICKKYDLKLAGEQAVDPRSDTELISEMLGISDILKKNAGATAEYMGGVFYECGNFDLEYRMNLTDGTWTREIPVHYIYRGKDYFDTLRLEIQDTKTAQQWNLSLEDGTELLIVNADNSVHILCDRADAFLTVYFESVYDIGNGQPEIMTRQDIEQVAKALDYTLKSTQIADMEAAKAHIEANMQLEDDQWESPFPDWEDHERKNSYDELIAEMRDNESYYTARCNVAYENFWDTFSYAFLDITGDGEDELILGKDGHVNAIWTMRDGRTGRVQDSHAMGYLCEGNYFADYSLLDGAPNYFFSKIKDDGNIEMIGQLFYHISNGTWEYTDMTKKNYGSGDTISEEKAMEIIGSYVPVSLDMKPVKEYFAGSE